MELSLTLELVHAAGLHRCPNRYPTTFGSDEDCEIRKRLFYAVYVLDRLVAKQLGHPLLFRDIDIDVCLPGADEIHGRPVAHEVSEGRKTKRRRLESVPATTPTSIHPSNPNQTPEGEIDLPVKYQVPVTSESHRLLPAFSLARLAGIMGRIMETFNGSRRWRAADRECPMRQC